MIRYLALWLQPLIAFLLLGGVSSYANFSRADKTTQSFEKTCVLQNGERSASLNRRSFASEPSTEPESTDFSQSGAVASNPFLFCFLSEFCCLGSYHRKHDFYQFHYPKSSPSTAPPKV